VVAVVAAVTPAVAAVTPAAVAVAVATGVAVPVVEGPGVATLSFLACRQPWVPRPDPDLSPSYMPQKTGS
jgi:hypothetical protein